MTDIRPRTIACLLRGIFQNATGFAAIFVGLWLGVDVGLIYHRGGEILDFPAFYWSWDFARESLAYPGGAAHYLSSLLMGKQPRGLVPFGALYCLLPMLGLGALAREMWSKVLEETARHPLHDPGVACTSAQAAPLARSPSVLKPTVHYPHPQSL